MTSPDDTSVRCGQCGKAIEGEPNFCPACGSDLRGLSPTSDTLSGPWSGTVIDGRYRVMEKLGEGGMGTVYKVEHTRMGKILALKQLRADLAFDASHKQRFMQEARMVAKLSHPNTVQVFDSGELADGSLYIAMEFLPGRDLAWHLRAHGAMREEKAISIALQLLASLEEAHGEGIIHRDLKPANVLVVRRKDNTDTVKLLDFGIAKLVENEKASSVTGGSELIGTPAYMSPEQARGDALDARSDLYSLGAMLFECVTGRQLFVGKTPMSVVTQHISTAAPRVSEVGSGADVSPAFEAVLRKVLAKNPADRYPSAKAMGLALRKVQQDLGALGDLATPTFDEPIDRVARREDFDAFEKALKRERYRAPAYAAAALLAVGGLGAFWWQSQSGALSTRELEPNQSAATATPVPLNADIEGTIGATEDGVNDVDLFVLNLSDDGPLRVSLSAVEELNLIVDVLQVGADAEKPQSLSRLLFLDDVAAGEPERVDALVARKGPLYVRVEERPYFKEANPARATREKANVPYRLRVDTMPGGPFEEEPNDTPLTAMEAPLTLPLTAFTGAPVDFPDDALFERQQAPLTGPDHFKVSVPDEAVNVAVLVVPPQGGHLAVVEGGALSTWLAKRSAGTSPGARSERPPRVHEVSAPKLLDLKPMGSTRLVRVQGVGTTPAGSAWRLAFLSSEANGLASVIALGQQLEQAGTPLPRELVTEIANRFSGSAQVAELRALVKPQKDGR